MNIRTILYIIIVPLTIWSLEGTRFEQLFKRINIIKYTYYI